MSSSRLSDRLFPGLSLWLLMAFMISIEAIWVYSGNYQISFGVIGEVMIAACIMALIGPYFHIRRPRIEMLLMSVAFFLLFINQARIFNHMMMAVGNPFVDSKLAAIDNAMGLDWLAYLAWVNSHALIAKVMSVVYYSLPKMMIFVVIAFVLLNMRERLREFFFGFAGMIVLTMVVGSYFPALGAYPQHHVSDAMLTNIFSKAGFLYIKDLIAINQGTMHFLDIGELKGLVTFPSFHTSMGVFLIWITRGTVLFVPFLILNLIMIAATPIMGGHYFADIIGGTVVAFIFMGASILDQAKARKAQPQIAIA